MKPNLLTAVIASNIDDIPKNNLVAFNVKGEPILFKDALLNYDDLKILIDNNDGIISHIVNTTMHWSPADRRDYVDYKEKLDIHLRDIVIHVTAKDKANWDSKETEAGAQLKANTIKELLSIHEYDLDVHVTKREKDRWNNTYTREETSNLLAKSKANTDWKDAVETYEDLYTVYPNAEPGWICTVLQNGVTYIFSDKVDDADGTIYSRWITAFTGNVPMATEFNNGQISKEMYIKISNIEDNANNYIHPDNINYRHVTDAEKKLWSNKASRDLATIFSPGLLASSDKEKLDTVEKYANYFVLPDKFDPSIILQDKDNRFITDEERKQWNDKPTGKIASEENDGQMSIEMFIKLLGIEEKANNYVHPLKHSSTDVAQDTLHRFVTDSQVSSWDAKEDKLQSQFRADKALEYAKAYTDNQIENRIGLAPSVLDTFEELANALNNDPDFAANVMISLSNKVETSVYTAHVSDYNTHLSANDRLKFNTMDVNANYYTHPDFHPATMISTDPNNRFISDVERTEWNAKANGNIATDKLPGQMAPEMVRKLNAITTTGMVMSDWNEIDENAGSFIRNKPTAMPAHGGNSETVNSYTAMELVNSRKTYNVVVGSSLHGYTVKDVDYLCDGTNDVAMINKALETINESGGSILFKEGRYVINNTIVVDKSVHLKGNMGTVFTGDTSLGLDPILRMSGISQIVEGITFDTGLNALELNTARFCKIYDCSFNKIKNGSIKLISCVNCVLEHNTFTNAGDKVIEMTSGAVANAHNEFNIVSNNSIYTATGTGIYLNSTTNSFNRNNTISGNMIYDCFSGIELTNEAQDLNTMNNVISNNNIMRANGETSDYLYEQHTIRIRKGQYNLVLGNVCRGRGPSDDTSTQNTHNMISENNIV